MYKIYKNFLTQDHAWDLACSIDSNPSNWFELTLNHDNTNKPLYLPLNISGYRKIFDNENSIRNTIINGKFAYRFHKTNTHVKGCTCWECEFTKNVLMSKSFKDLLIKETNLTNPVLKESFTSVYYPKDFLGLHKKDKSGVEFTFHLSWDWRPEYGGLFHLENDIGFQTYVPGWGDLLIMEVDKNTKKNFVSEVTEYAPRPRLAISGWFIDEE